MMCDICAQMTPFSAGCLFEGLAPQKAADAPDSTGGTLHTTLRSGDVFIGNLSVADIDVVKLSVTEGQAFTLSTLTNGTQSVRDTFLVLFDAQGTEIAFDDDSGTSLYSTLTHTATAQTYFAGVMSYQTRVGQASTDVGEYRLSLSTAGQTTGDRLPTYDVDQVADQLINGFWESIHTTARKFDGALTDTRQAVIHVDYSAMDAPGQWFAKTALNVWSAVTGIVFSTAGTTTDAPRITFDDEQNGAYAQTFAAYGGPIQNVFINVAKSWIAYDHYRHDSYSLQTFIHEIGHALGLGHAGNYNAGSGQVITYSNSAEFANDSWQASVMSYFSQTANTATQASRAYLLTPMMADILAAQVMYGTAGTLRTGDTVYGVGSTAGDYYDTLEDNWTNMAFVILDDGGIDLLDFSATTRNQLIDLRAEHLSDLGGEIGNMAIARGTVIEQAISGSGNDTLLGNSADNQLTGGNGDDLIDGGDGVDTAVYGQAQAGIVASLSAQAASGGAGDDTLLRIENIVGSNHDDILSGDDAGNRLSGGSGDDTLKGRGGQDTLEGGAGRDLLYGGGGDDFLTGGADDDILKGGGGVDWLVGDDGADTLRGGAGNDALQGGAQHDALWGQSGADRLFGGDGDDLLDGGSHDDDLFGGSGNDVLKGRGGADRIDGGTGNDILRGGAGADTFVFAPGDGHDRIKDWQDNADLLDLTAFGFSDFAQVVQAMHHQKTALKLAFSDQNIIILEHFDPTQFDAQDVVL